ncbi:MAG: hypothetical protein WA821_11650 [Anaerolineales bacterium]
MPHFAGSEQLSSTTSCHLHRIHKRQFDAIEDNIVQNDGRQHKTKTYLLKIWGELLLTGGFDTCTAFGAVYGGGTAPPPTQPPMIEKLHQNHTTGGWNLPRDHPPPQL